MKNSAILAVAVSVSFLLTACAPVSTSVKNEQAALTTDENVKLASVYETKGELGLALKFYKLAVEENKNSADIYFALGNVNLKMKLYKDAEDAYKKVLELKPASPAAYNNLSWLYLQTNELGKAEEAAKKAVKSGPHEIYAYLDTLGVVQIRMGKLTEAEENLKEAVALIPPEEKEGLKQIFNHQLELYKKTNDESKASSVQNKLNQLN
ncbi:tetratricopeptide repeat protein [bacterium]|nr:MAG: tetratricopeptide repeat protein [bacterium]